MSQLARTTQESISRRRGFITDALYYRRKGWSKQQKAALNCARCEKLNQMFFLGNPPF
ncbi:hypothetical protein [Erwinia sorbitola]|uniref:hypothetical protein n=1 Tax=Erwinia sorbitola TaxID=2681984 RepID=UPI0018CCE35D|nr:hypothetical protein [Erwinia sorbitola]